LLAAVISFAAAALAFAGLATALAITGSKHKVESGQKSSDLRDALSKSQKLEESLATLSTLRDSERKTIKARENEIENLRLLLREHAPSGVASIQFDRMLQNASGEDSDSDANGGDAGPVPSG
jgi:hypothetical protein